MNSDEAGSKIASAALRMRLKREIETALCVAGVLYLAVAERSIVAPGAIEEFVALDANGGEEGIGLVAKNAITEISESRA